MFLGSNVTGTSTNKAAEPLQPIIKRKKVVAGGGHHGGAWKVAYADFVTAMMAFFLLMWLLNATTEDQRKGLSDYFNPTIPVSRISGGGTDALNGSSMFSENKMVQDGTGSAKTRTYNEASSTKDQENNTAAGADAGEEAEKLEILQKAIAEQDGTISEHLLIKMTPEGLMIELVEADGEPLFKLGNAQPSALLDQLAGIVAAAFGSVENKLKVVGHTDASPFNGSNGYNNWDLSSDRANAARRLLVAKGIPATQIGEVSGKAETMPLSDDPYAAQNRRISITILRE